MQPQISQSAIQGRPKTPLKISAEKWEEIQEKIGSLIKTNDTLNQMLQEKTEEIDMLRLESKKGDSSDIWKRKYQQLEHEVAKIAQIEQEVAEYLPIMRSFEEKANFNERTVANLTALLQEKDKVIQDLQDALALSGTISNAGGVAAPKDHFSASQSEEFMKEILILKASLDDKDAEIERLNSGLQQIQNYEQKMVAMENAVNHLRSKEKDNFENLLREKSTEIQSLQRKLEISEQQAKFNLLRKDASEEIEEALHNLEAQHLEEKQTNYRLAKQLEDTQDALSSTQQELNQRDQRIEQLLEINEEIEAESKKLREFLQQSSLNNQQNANYENLIQQLKQQSIELQQNNAALNEELRISSQSLLTSKKQLDAQTAKIQSLSEQILSLQEEVTTQMNEKDQLLDKIAEDSNRNASEIQQTRDASSKRIQELEMQLSYQLTEGSKKSASMKVDYENAIGQMRQQVGNASDENQHLHEQLQSALLKIEEQQHQYEMALHEIENRNKETNDQQRQLDQDKIIELERHTENLEAKLLDAKQKMQISENALMNSQAHLHQLTEEIEAIHKEKEALLSENASIQNDFNSLQTDYESLMNQNRNIQVEYEKVLKQFGQLQTQIAQQQEQLKEQQASLEKQVNILPSSNNNNKPFLQKIPNANINKYQKLTSSELEQEIQALQAENSDLKLKLEEAAEKEHQQHSLAAVGNPVISASAQEQILTLSEQNTRLALQVEVEKKSGTSKIGILEQRLANADEQSKKADNLINELDFQNAELQRDIEAKRSEYRILQEKAINLELNLQDALAEVSKRDALIRGEQYEGSSMSMRSARRDAPQANEANAASRVSMLMNELDILKLEKESIMRKKDGEIRLWIEKANEYQDIINKEKELMQTQQKKQLQTIQEQDALIQELEVDIQRSRQLLHAKAQDGIYYTEQIQSLQDMHQEDQRQIADLKSHIMNFEDVFSEFKNEKMIYEDKILQFVDKVIELQKGLQKVTKERDDWERNSKIRSREIEEYKKKILSLSIDLNSAQAERRMSPSHSPYTRSQMSFQPQPSQSPLRHQPTATNTTTNGMSSSAAYLQSYSNQISLEAEKEQLLQEMRRADQDQVLMQSYQGNLPKNIVTSLENQNGKISQLNASSSSIPTGHLQRGSGIINPTQISRGNSLQSEIVQDTQQQLALQLNNQQQQQQQQSQISD